MIDGIVQPTRQSVMDPTPVVRRVERVRHELKRRELEVVAVERLSPGFVAVNFGGESLADFISLSFDDHVKFMIDGPGDEPVRRDYTPRSFDPAQRRLIIEFALHGHGGASEWARQARVGQRVVVGGPRGSMIIPTDYAWHLLAGDDTALPAIRRRLEELPAGTPAIVIVHADEADRLPLSTRAQLTVRWVDTSDGLIEAVRAEALPEGEGFVWCAGEAASMAAVRQVLLQDKKHPREAMRVAAYWKRGASEFHENLE
jgi:NADPH-dependent ferric siderophore reductase